ncbi:hypothetical protein [Modestobacter sp. I12A-02662]|uniref:hypothetical protein n=1 Tax=Modestobacter sp. I12A-02662 TaxID=1730496 RepID=UPI0034E04602
MGSFESVESLKTGSVDVGDRVLFWRNERGSDAKLAAAWLSTTPADAPTGSGVLAEVQIDGQMVRRFRLHTGSAQDSSGDIDAVVPPGGVVTVDILEVGSQSPGCNLRANLTILW